MKKIFVVMLVVVFGQKSFSQLPDSWTRKNDMGTVSPNPVSIRAEAVGFSIGTKGYFGTGGNATTKMNDFWEYDQATNSWSQKAALPGVARDRAVGFSVGTKGYLGTGQDAANNRLNDFWEYDPATNTWTQKANFAGTPRKGAVGLGIGNKGYLGTGNDANGDRTDFWEYDPATDTWIQKAVVPGYGRDEAAGFTIGNNGYIGGGYAPKTFYEYNPATNSWTQKANIPGNYAYENVGFSIGQKGYFSTGYSISSGITKETYEYNPATNTWTNISNNFTARRGAAGFGIGSKGYVVAGWDMTIGYLDDMWEYDPAPPLIQNRWNQRANVGGKNREAAIGFSIMNKGYVGGGYDGHHRNDFWEYDPISDSWSQKANIPGKPRSRGFGFGIGPKGYLGSGIDTLGNHTPDFWEYDPTTNRWTEKAPVYSGSTIAYVGFSIGKKGYAYGGGFATNFMEYDPETDIWTPKAVFPGPSSSSAMAFAVGNKGYVGLGGYKNIWEYDPATNIWTQKSSFPGLNRTNAIGFSLGNKGYVGTGHNTGFSNFSDIWEFDPATNLWTQRAPVPGNGRENAVAFTIGTRAFLGLGYDSRRNFLRDLWEYTPPTPPVLKDVAISAISSLPLNGCGFSAQQTITVSIANLGSQPESNIPVGCLVNGVPLTAAPEIFTGTIAPNTTASYTFSLPANLSAAGPYVIKPYTLLSGDNITHNDTATFKFTNWMRPHLPDFDFEAQNLPDFRVEPNRYNNIVNLNGSNNGNNSQGALYMMQANFPRPVNMVAPANVWNTYADRVGGIYSCFNPSGGSATDSLWLTFDLKQHFHMVPQNTNFRVMVNGQQVGPTYNPANAGSQNSWTSYKVDLFQFKNATSLEIGFESLLNLVLYNNTNPMNIMDNINVVRKIGTTTGLNPENPELQFQLFPNPTTGSFTVVASGKEQQLTVLDLNGKVIKTQTIGCGENLVTLPSVAKGIYLVRIISTNGVLTRKLVLQ
ncbi:kelch repeat-containing protein [Adhaeribacter terreus]|uniref:Kelch repeat-containing protein n=1 Tax=Adhaeribacter terreus TaxID=529703 RepID=A0ABW0EEY5_9BACT